MAGCWRGRRPTSRPAVRWRGCSTAGRRRTAPRWVGASAGLNLRWDRFRYEARGLTWGPADSPVRLCSYNSDVPLPFDVDARVVDRAGCDAAPVDPTTEDGRLTLLSYVWPDQPHRF